MSNEIQQSISSVAYADSIAQEKIWLKILQETNEKLRNSMSLLENQLNSVHEESNQWKTRFEIQKEINDYYRKALFICEQHVPKAKTILRIVNGATRKGVKVSKQLELDEDPIDDLEAYKDYLKRLAVELESRTEQEAKAYYWASDVRKRALVELNYTYVPAPVVKPPGEKANKGDELLLQHKAQVQKFRRLINTQSINGKQVKEEQVIT